MIVTFHEEANADLIEAAQFYEERASGLGLSFLTEVEEAIKQIIANPKSSPLISKEIHQRVLNRFPYSILYLIEPNRIRIITIAHQKRRPGFWHYRL